MIPFSFALIFGIAGYLRNADRVNELAARWWPLFVIAGVIVFAFGFAVDPGHGMP